MTEFGRALSALLNFAFSYELMKCIKTMLAGSVVALLLLFWQGIQKRKNPYLNIGSMFLLFPMCLMGSSKLFFTGKLWHISNWLCKEIKPWYGKIYLIVAGGLFAGYVGKSLRLSKRVRSLPLFLNRELSNRLVQKVSEGDRVPFFYWYLKRVRIYETQEAVSPFSGGLWHPYIVVPAQIVQGWSEEEISLILCHELLHIKAGHIWILTAFSFLRIYWWINPLIYICEKKLREELELACDESCLYYMKAERQRYAGALLHTLYLAQGMHRESILAFLRKDSFGELKRRLEALKRTEEEKYRKKVKRSLICSGVLTGAVLAGTISFSYPRFMRMEEIFVYNSRLEMLFLDSEEVEQAVQCIKGKIKIEEALLEEILRVERIEDPYIYISYDTIMKVPGIGGGGNVARVSTEDFTDIWYLADDGIENKILDFLLKYMI